MSNCVFIRLQVRVDFEILKSNYVLRLSLDEINQWATSKLASYKLPKKLITVHEIPRNAMGKVNKKSLIRELNL